MVIEHSWRGCSIRKTVLIISLMIVLAAIAGCGAVRKAVQIKGSDTMVNLTQAWAEEFMNENPLSSVAVTGGGSGTGIATLIASAADIALSSRDIKDKEIFQAKAKGVAPVEIHVANDGIAVAVNQKNPINELNISQLSDIFSGKISNWKALGGPDMRIVPISRDRSSGTHVFFLEHVVKLGKNSNPNEFSADVLMLPSSQAIVEEVSSNPSAIGYIGLGYLSGRVKALAIAKGVEQTHVRPTIGDVRTRKYPISRSLFFYTNGAPTGEVKAFVDFVLSKAGQDIVLKMDFVPIK